ncbi:hypothetical protein HaLaN_14927, partial [Haematococcus lacustris]
MCMEVTLQVFMFIATGSWASITYIQLGRDRTVFITEFRSDDSGRPDLPGGSASASLGTLRSALGLTGPGSRQAAFDRSAFERDDNSVILDALPDRPDPALLGAQMDAA